jgi:DNA-binding response OmpR family regulator
MAPKILLVDDDAAFRKMMKRYLETHDFSVVDTDNGSQALLLARETKPDLVLSDAEMPGLDGHGLCRVIRQEPDLQSIPIILMSGSRIQDKNVLAGLEGGADDYMLKPFSNPVLVAKIQVVLRRYEGSSKTAKLMEKCGMELDPAGRSVRINGKPVSLTRKEFDLLTLLLQKPGRVLNTPYLLETIWGYDLADYNDPGTVEVHISHLRKKLGPKIAKHIINLKGIGYKFEEIS